MAGTLLVVLLALFAGAGESRADGADNGITAADAPWAEIASDTASHADASCPSGAICVPALVRDNEISPALRPDLVRYFPDIPVVTMPPQDTLLHPPRPVLHV